MTPTLLAEIYAEAFPASRPWHAEEFDTFLQSPFCFVKGDQYGFSLGRVTVDEAELLTIAVRPSAQGQGFGHKWLSGFEQGAHHKGAVTAFLEVAADNAPARALYDRAGYIRQNLRPNYYTRSDGNRIDALVMARELTQGQPT